MRTQTHSAQTVQMRWAQFRFSIIGVLLSAPPHTGELQCTLKTLSEKQWKHPITGLPMKLGVSTLERWLYRAKKAQNPIGVLQTKRRSDAAVSREMSAPLKGLIQQQYQLHPSWSYQLHIDNLKAVAKTAVEKISIPSYSTLRRYMQANGLCKKRNIRKHHTAGALCAAARLESREVRSYEVEQVHGLWHLDFHHGSRKILNKEGEWHKPLLLAILDDRSRIICHAQWYMDETAETLVHGFMQALQKRRVPRALMSDNGAAMVAAEFTEGLATLSILHQPTLPYSPYQNAKQEVFWAQVEGRLMAMLEGESELTLKLLNEATIAWIEFEYHRKIHTELGVSPMARYLNDPQVGRTCPEVNTLRAAFCITVNRKQRRSDGSFSLDGQRFEVPSQYRHLTVLCVRYARWDMSYVTLIDPHTQGRLCTLYPQDKIANAHGMRRRLEPLSDLSTTHEIATAGIAPLLKSLMAEYAATGLPPAYLPKGEKK